MIAEDGVYGNVLQQQLVVNVISPECAPASGPVTLLAGPDPLHQVVGTVPRDALVIVDARDKTGDWLRVSGLTGGVAGWGHDADVRLWNLRLVRVILRIETNVLEPPTLTPTFYGDIPANAHPNW